MDELDKKIKRMFEEEKTSAKYDKMIEETLKMIYNNEISRDEKSNVKNFNNKKEKKKSFKLLKPIAAALIIGLLSITTYAGVMRRLNISDEGYVKIDKNYDELATTVGKNIETEDFTLTLESMAADPAYLICEYKLILKEQAMQKVGDIQYDEFNGYEIYLNHNITINDKDIDITASWNTVKKIAQNEYAIINLYNIANFSENELYVTEKLNNLYIGKAFNYALQTEINQSINSKITFTNRDKKILAETKLSNDSTLYIEEIANSKFENYVLARIVTSPKRYGDIFNKSNEFMIEDPQFAICDENGNTINYDFKRLEDYYEEVSEETGEVLGKLETYGLDEDEVNKKIVRLHQVQILKLSIDEENPPKKLQIVPLNRKLYNDRNSSEADFYANENWYQVKVGEMNITEESTIGGSITIKKIEETDDKIVFYYDESGFVPSFPDFVLRIKNKKMNYTYPLRTLLKGINADDNMVIYSKTVFDHTGMPLLGYETYDNLDDLEFALFYNAKYDVLSEPLLFDWNAEESEQRGIIEIIN